MARPKVHDEALRLRLLDEAGRLLSAEGAAGLSLRRIATDAGTSTTAVYSLFGGKPELVRALFLEAFGRFATRLAAVALGADPAENLVRLGIAYREAALADPHLYAVMFGRAVPEFTPDAPDREVSLSAMRPLLEAVRAGIAAGVLVPAPPETIVVALWGYAHGLVSLELNDAVPEGFDVATVYEAAVRAAIRGWTVR
ncbi:MAG TPA: TetR/AcrR family transcriptional regulator [Pseudonocardiaceae bacterium]|jgi:AcrR family transcriptional regulator|nr:TetR/AcrR family transcriptional regulator [Pseudonocardiaceae bacterium]